MRDFSMICSILVLLALLIQSEAFPSSPSLARRAMSLDMALARPWKRNRGGSAIRKAVRVKPRDTVIYNPSTGTTASSTTSRRGWKSIKSTVYNTFDAVGSLTSRFPRFKKQQPPPRRPIDGYSLAVEQRVLADSTDSASPGQRLMQEYKERGPALEVIQPKETLFDSIKESVYSVADSITSPPKPVQAPPAPTTTVGQPFKAAIQPSIAMAPEIRAALPQLNSRNPVKRYLAERKIRHWEEEQRRREEALEREAKVEALKNAVYAVVDNVQTTAGIVAATPAKVVQTASATQQFALSMLDWAKTVPGSVQSTVDTISAIPKQVEQTMTNVQNSVDATFQTTQNFVGEVVAIPSKVQRSVESTQQGIENTVKAVDDVATNVKVWTGLEKPKPPPPPPPKELTFSNIAMDLVGGLASGGAQLAWWVGKGAVKLSAKGVKSAFEAATKKKEEKPIELTTAAAVVLPSPPKTPPPPAALTLADVSSKEFEQEVSEAIAIAESALSKSTENVGLEEAVRRAKQAAIAATQDTVEVETKKDIDDKK